MIEWYKIAMFQNYSNFSGRARRSEYWYFRLATAVIFFALIAFAALISVVTGGALAFQIAIVFFIIYALLSVIPSLAVTVRRMHDLGKSGWNILISCIPLVGPIWFLILLATEGEHGENYYGPDPKSAIEEIDEIGVNNN